MPDGVVKFDRYELHEITYKKNMGFEGDSNISLTIQSQDHTDKPNVKRVILTVQMTGVVDATIILAGIFSLTKEFTDRYDNKNLNIIATSILLPYTRSILSFVSAADGSQPVLLPTVNLNTILGENDLVEETENKE